MPDLAPYVLDAYLQDESGTLEPVSIRVDPPLKTEYGWYRCAIFSSMLARNPHHASSDLALDAWASAFVSLKSWLRADGKRLVDARGTPIALPSPPRDESPIPPRRSPDVTGIAPIYRVEGWANVPGRPRQRVELAIWPAQKEADAVFCAPMRSGLREDGRVICSLGAYAEQAVYLAYLYLVIEVKHSVITDDDGLPLAIPVPPEPAPLPPP